MKINSTENYTIAELLDSALAWARIAEIPQNSLHRIEALQITQERIQKAQEMLKDESE